MIDGCVGSGGCGGSGVHGERWVAGDHSYLTITLKVDSSLAKCLNIVVDHVEVNLHGW